MKGKTIAELNIGDRAHFQKSISETDVRLFAEITGDNNPVHLNDIEAKESPFKERVAHGMLTAGLISAVLGAKLPGPGTIYLKQDLRFVAPVKIGDTIFAEVKIIEINKDKNIVKLNTICYNQNNSIVINGIATVMPPKSRGV